MSFGQIIKKLRREADYTQESLAELLGISPQAVSRWECDQAMPDISMLPRLANLFDVSTDVLLGIDLGQKERKTDEIAALANSRLSDGYSDEAVRILREGLLTYPNSYKLMCALSDALFLRGELDESLKLAEWVMEHAADLELQVQAISGACCIYDRQGQHERAVELAQTIPEFGRDDLLHNLLTGSAHVDQLRHEALIDGTTALFCLFQLIRSVGDDGTPAYTPTEQRKLCEKCLALYDLFFEDGDFYFYEQFPAQLHRELARLDTAEGKADGAVAHLREYVRRGLLFAAYDPEAPHTSLAFRGETDGGWVRREPDFDYRRELAEWLDDAAFDPLRGREDFDALRKSLG